MNSIAKTPKTHRSELLRFVHRPQLIRIDYPHVTPLASRLITSLQVEFGNYDLSTDPYVIELCNRQSQGHDVSRDIEKIFTTRNTYCYRQPKPKDQELEQHERARGCYPLFGTLPSGRWFLASTAVGCR